jgi:hypothetical protein
MTPSRSCVRVDHNYIPGLEQTPDANQSTHSGQVTLAQVVTIHVTPHDIQQATRCIPCAKLYVLTSTPNGPHAPWKDRTFDLPQLLPRLLDFGFHREKSHDQLLQQVLYRFALFILEEKSTSCAVPISDRIDVALSADRTFTELARSPGEGMRFASTYAA